MTKNFRARIDKLIAKFVFAETTLQYIQFAYQFAVNLHKANSSIPDKNIKKMKQAIQEHFDSEEDIQKVPRLPPLDLVEAVQISCLTQFKNTDAEYPVGKDLFQRIYDIHEQLCKSCVQPVIEDIDYVKYLCNVAVLTMQGEFRVKYDTAFWPDFKFKDMDDQDVYYLLNKELKMFNTEWKMPKSEFKYMFFELYHNGSSKPKSKAKATAKKTHSWA